MSDELEKKDCCEDGCEPCAPRGSDPQGFIDQAREKIISRRPL